MNNNSWFKLILDTTPPKISISAPKYVSNNEEFNIIVSLNGETDIDKGYQEAYVKDTDMGRSYKVILTYNELTNDFSGIFNSSILLGSSGTIEVSLRDTVYNIGKASCQFKIIGSGYLDIKLKDCLRRAKLTILNNKGGRRDPMLLSNQIEVGDTKRFIASFVDFSGNPTDVDGAVFKIYDRSYNIISIGDMHPSLDKNGEHIIGLYYYDFFYDKEQELTVEAYGVIDNTPALIREKVVVVMDDRRL